MNKSVISIIQPWEPSGSEREKMFPFCIGKEFGDDDLGTKEYISTYHS